MDLDAFLTNELVIDAVARNLEIIGEAVRQLPEDFSVAEYRHRIFTVLK